MNKIDKCNKVESVSQRVASENEHVIDADIEVLSVDENWDDHQDDDHNVNESQAPSEKKDLEDSLDTLSTINAEVKADSKLLFNDFLAITTLHGIKYVYNNNYSTIRRFSWVCFMVTSYVLFLLTAREHITKYHARLTKEEFSTERKTSIGFPSVTICNSNIAKASLVDNPPMNTIIRVILDGSVNRGWGSFVLNETDDVLEAQMDEVLLAIAHQASDMILECAWKRGAKACGAANFTRRMTSAGLCYTFNDGDFEGDDDIESDARLEINRSGTKESFWVRLNAEVDEYVSTLNPEGTGFKLLVHRRGDVPLVTDVGVAIMPGVRTLIAIKKQTVQCMSYPYDTDCRDTRLDHYPFYSEGACLTECETIEATEACACKLPHMPGPYPVCTVRQYAECALPAFVKETNVTTSKCQRACYTEHFRMTMSYLKAPGKRDTQRLQNQFNWTREDVTNNIAELEIYFADMNEHHIKSVPAYGVADLWGDLGGIIGVHLGASLLTLFEFFDYAFVEHIHRLIYFRFFWRKIKSFCSQDKKVREIRT